MNPELERQIHEAAPRLFRNTPEPDAVTGWSPNKIARVYCPAHIGVGNGWYQLLLDLVTALESLDEVDDLDVMQIKEKFGGLRFYVGPATSMAHDLIEAAEDLSVETCEECGEPGKPRRGGWIRTLCDTHHKELK